MQLVDVEPKNPYKGTRTIFYLRNNGKSVIHEQDIGNFFYSHRLTDGEADELRKKLENLLPGIEIKKLDSAKKYVVNFFGPREFGDIVGRYSVNSRPGETLKLMYPPLSTLTNGEVSDKVSLEKLMNDSWCSLDVEVKNAFTNNPFLYLASLVTEKEGVAYTTLQTKRNFLTASDLVIPIVKCNDPMEIAVRTAEFIREHDPRFLFGYNIGFDLSHLRKAGGFLENRDHGLFRISTDGDIPKIEGGIPGSEFKKWTVAGRDIIDPYPFHRNNAWYPDYTLETVTNLRGIEFEKAIEGENLDAEYEKALTDPETAEKLCIYGANDAIIQSILARKCAPLILTTSLDMHTDPTTASFNANPVTKYYDVVHFKELKTVRNNREMEVDVHEGKIELLKLRGDAKKGLFEVRVLYIPLIKNALRSYLEPRFPRLFNYKTGDITERILATVMIEDAAIELLNDLNDGELPDRVFGGRHKMDRGEVRYLLQKEATKYSKILSEGKKINAVGKFVFLKADNRGYEDVLELGKGSALSLESGRIVVDIEGKKFGFGVDIRGSRGHKTDFERELIEELLDSILVKKNPDGLVGIAKSYITHLQIGNVDRKKLIYRIKDVKRPWFAISYKAVGRKRSKIIQEHQMMEGESRRYGLVLINGMQKDLEEKEFVVSEHPIDVFDYIEKFGNGTAADIIEAAIGRGGRNYLSLQHSLF